jgi:hypothetical protein
MRFSIGILLIGIATAHPATLKIRECPVGAHGVLCPAKAAAGEICCVNDVVCNTLASPGTSYSQKRITDLGMVLDWQV